MESFKNNNSTSEGMAFVCMCHLGPHVAAQTGDSQLTIPREVRKRESGGFSAKFSQLSGYLLELLPLPETPSIWLSPPLPHLRPQLRRHCLQEVPMA